MTSRSKEEVENGLINCDASALAVSQPPPAQSLKLKTLRPCRSLPTGGEAYIYAPLRLRLSATATMVPILRGLGTGLACPVLHLVHGDPCSPRSRDVTLMRRVLTEST